MRLYDKFTLLWISVITFPLTGLSTGYAGPTWVRGAVRAANFVAGKDAHETFQLQVIRHDKNSLTGMAVLTREISESHPNHAAIDIEGVEREGRFWPFVRGEVSNDRDGGWENVLLTQPLGKPARRRIQPQTLGEAIFIDLAAFGPHIGRRHFGRVVLPNAEAMTFFLENLKPPAKTPETWSRAGMGGDEELHPSAYEMTFLVPPGEQTPRTFGLIRVEGKGGQVMGHFVYGGKRGAAENEKKGYDQPIPLQARLRVTNDYHTEWTTIGTASGIKIKKPPAVSLSATVNLGKFQPMIGKYRYGKVVLPSGAFAIIQLVDLLPPEKELIAKEHPDWRQ